MLRTAAAGAVAMLLGAGCSHSAPKEQAAEPARRPNVVFILADDLDTASPYWSAMPKTKGLIADRGLTFTNAFVTDPVCAPSRASLLTGLYAHNNGVLDPPTGDDSYSAFAATGESPSIATRMHDAGYSTAFFGKYVNGYENTPQAVPPGWDEWFGLAGTFYDGYTYDANHNGRMEHYGNAPSDYQTDVLSRQARSFLDDKKNDKQPFFLYMSPSAPHWSIPPAPRDAHNRFADAALPRGPNFDEPDVSDKPLWLRDGGWKVDLTGRDSETERYQRAMGSLYAVDDMVGAIADDLRARDELDDTIFVFMSDNGYNRGAHRLNNKMAPYEESIRVPLVVAGPGIRHGSNDRFVTNLDLVPTILDLTGAPGADDTDGRSVAPLLRGTGDGGDDDVLVEYRGNYSAVVQVRTMADVRGRIQRTGAVRYMPSYDALRTKDWLYVQWYEGPEHEYELYDMHDDPHQLTNLLADPARAADLAPTVAGLQARMDTLTTCAGSSCR